MRIYNFDQGTGEFLGAEDAQPNPLEPASFLIPAGATPMPPPTVPPDHRPVFGRGVWTALVDRRGQSWWSQDGTRHEVTTLGEDFPQGAITDAPPDGAAVVRRGGEWIAVPRLKTLDQASMHLVQMIGDVTQRVTGPIPEDERISWPIKAQAARAYLDGIPDQLQTMMIESEASVQGERPEDLAQYILDRAALFVSIIAPITGLRRKWQAALQKMDMIQNPWAYDEALAQAEDEISGVVAALSSEIGS